MSEDALKQKLSHEVDELKWPEFAKIYAKSLANVIEVDQGLDLVEVGIVLAQDDSESLQKWLAAELIKKPSLEQMAHWQACQQSLQLLIVKPFVLVREH